MTVAFASNRPLERAENTRATWDAYGGAKWFVQGISRLGEIGNAFSVCVYDDVPPRIRHKGKTKGVFIGHGLTGGKWYAKQARVYLPDSTSHQIDFAICSSTYGRRTMSTQLGIPVDRVLPLGMPRTDAYVGKRKGDGGTMLADKRAYLYVPTFRGERDLRKGAALPSIDWAALDAMMDDGEVLAVKRHMLMPAPMLDREYAHIVEVGNEEPSTPWLIDCNVVATDFSSILFDGYVLGKPSVLVTDGAAAYMKSRGMYHEYPAWYGSNAVDVEGAEAAFLDALRRAEFGPVEQACREQVADACDGSSAARVAELIASLA